MSPDVIAALAAIPGVLSFLGLVYFAAFKMAKLETMTFTMWNAFVIEKLRGQAQAGVVKFESAPKLDDHFYVKFKDTVDLAIGERLQRYAQKTRRLPEQEGHLAFDLLGFLGWETVYARSNALDMAPLEYLAVVTAAVRRFHEDEYG